MIEVLSKQRKLCNQLTAVCNNVNTDYIITFISDRLAKTIHHRNHSRHYRTSSKVFKENVDTTYSIDVDFSENLTILVKFEPQRLRRCHQEVTIHSGIIISQSEKSYLPYVSDDRKNDQIFVHMFRKNVIRFRDTKKFLYCYCE